jgi:arsenate reductase (thioredoxin)
MAEGIVNSRSDCDFISESAGVKKAKVHPLAIQVMDEIGIDISKQYSKLVTELKDKEFDYVVTVCDHAKEACPFFPGKNIIHKGFADPGLLKGSKEDNLVEFRRVRDEIKSWIIDQFC